MEWVVSSLALCESPIPTPIARARQEGAPQQPRSHPPGIITTPRAWWNTDSSPPPASYESTRIYAAAGILNPSLQTRLDPPAHPDHPPCRPRPGPTGPACWIDADSEL